MSKELELIWRHGRVYAFGRVLDRLAALLLIPVLVHLLTPEEWGVYALVLVITEVLAVAPMGILYTMIRLYFDEAGDAGHRDRVIGTTLRLLAAVALVLALAAWPLALATTWIVFGAPAHVLAFTLANLGIALSLLFELELDWFRADKRSRTFVAASLARSVLQFGLSIAFVWAWGLGVTGVVLGNLAAAALVALPIAGHMVARHGLSYSRPVAGEMLRIGLPLIPAWLGRSALELADRALVNALAGTAALGLYALGARLADQLRLLMSGPFYDIWVVRLIERGGRAEAAEEFNRAQLLFLALLALAALALAAFAPEIVLVIADREFAGAAAVVPLLALNALVRPVVYHFQTGLLERKRTASLPAINWSTVALGVAAMALLIPPYGIVGAAAAMLAAWTARLALSAWAAARVSDYARQFPWVPYGGIVLASVVFYAAITTLTGAEITLLGLLVKLGLIGLFVAALILGPVLTAEERSMMLRGIRRLRGMVLK